MWNEGIHYSCFGLLGLLDMLYIISSGITADVLIALFVFSNGICDICFYSSANDRGVSPLQRKTFVSLKTSIFIT